MGRLSDMRGRMAVVTGACSGIGLQFARVLAASGADLLMISNRPEELAGEAARLAEEFGISAAALPLDLTESGASDAVVAELERLGRKPYVLVNNAGIFSFNPVLDTPQSKIDCFIRLHVEAVTRLCIAVGRIMAEAGEGYILNMSSMACWTPMPGIAMYSATKAYIRNFSRALRLELKDSGVRVMAACPGGIATDLFGLPENLKKLALSLHAIERPEDFTRKALKRLLKGRKQYVNGLINRLGIVFVGAMPESVRVQIKRLMLDRNIRRP